jgi:hypothetical protein
MAFTDDDGAKHRVSAFTNDDLKKLKDLNSKSRRLYPENDPCVLPLEMSEALIARLESSEADRDYWKQRCEAAERLVELHEEHCGCEVCQINLEKWRKACGR